jgi:hypothetical protein
VDDASDLADSAAAAFVSGIQVSDTSDIIHEIEDCLAYSCGSRTWRLVQGGDGREKGEGTNCWKRYKSCHRF